MSKKIFLYNDFKIEYEIIRKPVKNINLRIRSDKSIVISANRAVSESYIEGFMQSKADWILKHISSIPDIPNDDTSFRFLGKNYTIIKKLTNDDEFVDLTDAEVIVFAKELDRVDSVIDGWLKEQAKIEFAKSIDRNLPLLKGYGVKRPTVTIRKMKTRWGSCSVNKGKISLNLLLMEYDRQCIDHVVLHELVHFIYPNHGEDFYKLIYKLMPDYKERKNRLKMTR